MELTYYRYKDYTRTTIKQSSLDCKQLTTFDFVNLITNKANIQYTNYQMMYDGNLPPYDEQVEITLKVLTC